MRDESERVGRPQPGHERARVPQELGGALDRLQFCHGESVGQCYCQVPTLDYWIGKSWKRSRKLRCQNPQNLGRNSTSIHSSTLRPGPRGAGSCCPARGRASRTSGRHRSSSAAAAAAPATTLPTRDVCLSFVLSKITWDLTLKFG